MTEQGYIKLHRSILNWEWWSDDKTLKVFLWLLLNANWEDSRFKGHEVPKGSLVSGRKKIAKELNLSEREVRTSLEHLKSTNEITIKPTNRFSVITITNWEKYQCLEIESTNKLTNKPSDKRPTSDHIKEYKEYKNIRNNKSLFASPYDFEQLQREIKNGKN